MVENLDLGLNIYISFAKMKKIHEIIKSPCKKICQLDMKTGLCKGCLRNQSEISGWITMSEVEKKNVLKKLILRKLSIG